MALSLTELQAATDAWYNNIVPEDLLFRDTILLYCLMYKDNQYKENMITAGELADGGTHIKVPLEIAKANTGGYGKDTEVSTTKVEVVNAALYTRGGVVASNSIDLLEKEQNTGTAAQVKLIKVKVENVMKTCRDSLNYCLYHSRATSRDHFNSGVAEDYIYGLDDLFNTSTSTPFGGIAEDDLSYWKANVIAHNDVISLDLLRQMRRTPAIGSSNKKKPNLYLMPNNLKDSIEAIAQSFLRTPNVEMVNLGFDNIVFGHATIVGDDDVTSGHIEGLNLNYLAIKTSPDYAFTKPQWGYDYKTPDKLTVNTRWRGAFITTHRGAHVRATGVSEA